VPTEPELVLRLAIALVLGGAIGLERELTGQVAGLRTHMSVALGSALFAVVSAYSFSEFVEPRAETNYQIDVTSIASNVVTGVGFLGGGAIIKLGASVRGLTTAASMWVTAAVGLAVGLGNHRIGALSAGALILALTLLRGRRRWLSPLHPDEGDGDHPGRSGGPRRAVDRKSPGPAPRRGPVAFGSPRRRRLDDPGRRERG